MKVFALFVLVLGGLVPCYADTTQTQTWNIQTSCNPQFYQQVPPCQTPANINAVFTTTLESGTFYSETGDFTYTGTAYVVTNITGTFDGLPMTGGVTGPPGRSNWMEAGDLPQDVTFTAGGNEYDLFYDGLFTLAAVPGPPFSSDWEYLNWNAIGPTAPVPEPSTLLLLIVPLLLAVLSGSRQELPCPPTRGSGKR